MANGPTLSQAIRGRSMVQRDYTAGERFKSAERRADEAVTTAGLGIVQGIAGGVAQLTGAIESNIKSHELAEEGARSVFESSGLEGSFEESGFQSAEGWRDRWFKSAAEVSETAVIGEGTFDTAKLIELGRLSPVARSKAAGRSLDKHGEPTGEYKSLYEEFRMQEPLGRNITQMESAEVAGSKQKSDLTSHIKDKWKMEGSTEQEWLVPEIGNEKIINKHISKDNVETNVLPTEDLASEAYMKWYNEEGGKEVHGKRSAFEEKYPQFKK